MHLNKHNFNIARFASTDPGRIALQNLQIRPDGTTEATCGRMLARLAPVIETPEPDRPEKSVLCAASDAKAAAKLLGPHSSEVGVNGAVTVPAGSTLASYGLVDSHFPNTEQIINEERDRPRYRVLVNPALLEQVAKFAREITGARAHGTPLGATLALEFSKADPLHHALRCTATSKDGQEFEALLMPVAETTGQKIERRHAENK